MKNLEDDINFKVPGAGHLRISNSANCKCGDAVGFAIGLGFETWNPGGVIDKSDAKKLAEHILKVLNK